MAKIKGKKGKNKGGDGDSSGLPKQGIQFNKDLGQHILKNPLVITSMMDKVRIQSIMSWQAKNRESYCIFIFVNNRQHYGQQM